MEAADARAELRVVLDPAKLNALGLQLQDILDALSDANLDLPAGSIESQARNFTVGVKRSFRTAEDFSRLVLARGGIPLIYTVPDRPVD